MKTLENISICFPFKSLIQLKLSRLKEREREREREKIEKNEMVDHFLALTVLYCLKTEISPRQKNLVNKEDKIKKNK